MRSVIGRRRFLTISAAAAGVALVPLGASQRTRDAQLVEWTGLSLGGLVAIRLHHPDRRAGEALLRRVVTEARRLETIFSLYERDTALCELNRRGVLVAPPTELVELLGLCDRFWRLTGGVFDPTVQPLWLCYAEHFSTKSASADGPTREKLEEALRLVGWQNVRFGRDRVAFERRGIALTLNGVAQGYITDRVVELLREAGIDNCLVDMGEIRTLGVLPYGRPWHVALRGPADEASPHGSIDLVNKAVATSGADGFKFDEAGRCNHLFNPTTGLCADPERSITVVAASAAAADALSTAFSLMDQRALRGVLAGTDETQVYVTSAGKMHQITTERARAAWFAQ